MVGNAQMTKNKETAIEKKAHKQALLDFRQQYFYELEKNLKVATKIRDGKSTKTMTCPYCKKKFTTKGTLDKDKNEAIKIISRMLAALQPDQTTQASAKSIAQQAQQIQKPGISPELQAKLDKLKTNVE